ncbi:MAG: DNA alkylation repair protein [Lachnospiraceae bacterium]|nr:DNA alkylation repair protein [Lachnospiraceae bacterium]
MRKDIREQLLTMAENDYQKFSAALIPGVENMLGIRLPQLRKLAKDIAKLDWKEAIKDEDFYFEERMLRGMIISYASKDMDEMLPYIEAFIPLVDNWSICDSVFMGMEIFQKNRERAWKFIEPYLQSHKEYEVRVALIVMMQHLLKCDKNGKKIARLRTVDVSALSDVTEEKGLYIDRVLKEVDKVDTTDYYASMAASWLIAEAFCCYPYHTYEYMKMCNLDDRTYNKGIQKIVESRIPTDEVKNLLRGMKRR